MSDEKARCLLCPAHKETLITNKCTTNKWDHLRTHHYSEYVKLTEKPGGSKQGKLDSFGMKKKNFPQSESQIRVEMVSEQVNKLKVNKLLKKPTIKCVACNWQLEIQFKRALKSKSS